MVGIIPRISFDEILHGKVRIVYYSKETKILSPYTFPDDTIDSTSSVRHGAAVTKIAPSIFRNPCRDGNGAGQQKATKVACKTEEILSSIDTSTGQTQVASSTRRYFLRERSAEVRGERKFGHWKFVARTMVPLCKARRGKALDFRCFDVRRRVMHHDDGPFGSH